MNAPFPQEAEVFSEEIDPFLMANLYPRETGLPMTIWAGPRAGARHDVRVKVSMAHGDRMDADNLATMSVRPEPRLLHGHLSGEDQKLAARWIALNAKALIGYWDGDLGTVEFVRELRSISA